VNIGADIGAMAASVRLVFPGVPITVAILCFAVFIVVSQILLPYNKYVKILKYLTLSLFAYIITAIIVGGSWSQILVATIIPHIEFTSAFAMMYVAILGATITPYVFFWLINLYLHLAPLSLLMPYLHLFQSTIYRQTYFAYSDLIQLPIISAREKTTGLGFLSVNVDVCPNTLLTYFYKPAYG